MTSLLESLDKTLGVNTASMLGKENTENVQDTTRRNIELEEANNLIAYGIKESLTSDDAENWSDTEKLAYYHKCQFEEGN